MKYVVRAEAPGYTFLIRVEAKNKDEAEVKVRKAIKEKYGVKVYAIAAKETKQAGASLPESRARAQSKTSATFAFRILVILILKRRDRGMFVKGIQVSWSPKRPAAFKVEKIENGKRTSTGVIAIVTNGYVRTVPEKMWMRLEIWKMSNSGKTGRGLLLFPTDLELVTVPVVYSSGNIWDRVSVAEPNADSVVIVAKGRIDVVRLDEVEKVPAKGKKIMEDFIVEENGFRFSWNGRTYWLFEGKVNMVEIKPGVYVTEQPDIYWLGE